MEIERLIDDYAACPAALRKAVQGLTKEQLDAHPAPGRWSIREVVAHLADFEPISTDRIKRVIAFDNPVLMNADENAFAARLAYSQRDVEEDLVVIESLRKHTARILRTLSDADFQRVGEHSTDGPLTLEQLLKRVTRHFPHHIAFIEEKRRALGVQDQRS